MRKIALMALGCTMAVGAAGCSVRTERVVETPAPTTTQRTTTVTNDPYQPTQTTTTTTYPTPR